MCSLLIIGWRTSFPLNIILHRGRAYRGFFIAESWYNVCVAGEKSILRSFLTAKFMVHLYKRWEANFADVTYTRKTFFNQLGPQTSWFQVQNWPARELWSERPLQCHCGLRKRATVTLTWNNHCPLRLKGQIWEEQYSPDPYADWKEVIKLH